MAFGVYVATAGAVARQSQLDIVANNLANVSTPGYRAQEVGFLEVLRSQGAPDRHLVMTGQKRLDTTPGHLEETGNPSDLSLDGPGFFGVLGPENEPLLTRTLNVRVDEQGQLVDSAGQIVITDGPGPELDPGLPVVVSAQGRVQQGSEVVGQILVFDVTHPAFMAARGNRLYVPTDESGPAFEVEGVVRSGVQESSNVNAVQSMVKLIRVERDFQSLMKVLMSYKQADESLIQQTSG